ncbi:hypothetical protein HU200_002254 [Digitaria exilis]|uniref:Ubiquitin-like protein ATG12 n=1 Tax=Digitaria exilis TaxID=1010633 RepID=A0A835KZL6_9POAL|nr:hypothetical protein HU200_002254 [Digitaria exilis]
MFFFVFTPLASLSCYSCISYQISGRDKFLKVIEFLRRQLHQDTLFVYINSAFSPNPDELVIDLYNVRF